MPALEPLRHELISASAGSGKTFQLVRRYLHLLALGVDPTSVAAMTFTRKAAGEFFNRILNQLARLADGEADAKAYFDGMRPAVPAGVDYLALLRQLTLQMQRLRLGTLDSFFASVTACFPLELGLPAGASVMMEEETQQRRDQAIDQLLDRLQEQRDGDATQLLLEGIKQSSFGAEEKRTEEALRDWVKEGQELWTSRAGDDSWGRVDRIWPGRFNAPGTAAVTLQSLREDAQHLRDLFPTPTAGAQQFLDELVDEASRFEPGQSPKGRLKFYLEKTAEIWPQLEQAEARLTWNRQKVVLSGEFATAWRQLAESMLVLELQVRAHRTIGVARILERFEQMYDESVRSRGLLSFADVPQLLRGMTNAVKDDLWFRLDGRYEHWLLDEFQDTSFLQWDVMHPLVDEVMQDPEGDRSFFGVGDPKQSIYLWRQAEPGLFAELLSDYPIDSSSGRGLHPGTLSKSYRSCQPVLDAVNATFEDAARIQELLPGAEKTWTFSHHESSQPELSGCAQLISYVAEKGSKENDSDPDAPKPLHQLTAALLTELQPLKRGLTCAILVRGNKTALSLTETMRALTDMPIVCESQQHPATDNAVTLALLSLLQYAAHPGDRYALEHLLMTPLAACLKSPHRIAGQTLEQIGRAGFGAFIQHWITELEALEVDLDAFHRLRLSQLADLGAEFDSTGSRDIDQFLTTARDQPLRTRGITEAIQVMTVHASKGLEFDIVILPDLDTDGMANVRHADWSVARHRGVTEWVLQSPPKTFVTLDPLLSAHQRTAEETAGFESLCRLYVAMTRAKRGLYLLSGPPPAKPSSMKPIRFLRTLLDAEASAPVEISGIPAVIEWETGDANWQLDHPLGDTPPEHPITTPDTQPLGTLIQQVQPRQRRVTPSGEESFSLPGKVLFSPQRDVGRRLGNHVHEQLALISWWSTSDDSETAKTLWRAAGLLTDDDESTVEAARLSLNALTSSDCTAAFAPVPGEALVWREKPFDLIHEGNWVSGTFDRLIVYSDRAHLIDFKTDDVSTPEALDDKVRGYTPQLQLYRRAAARLTGLAESDIQVSLLFVRGPQLVEVNW